MSNRAGTQMESDTEPRRPERGDGPRVRIIWFTDGARTAVAEREIEALLAAGWRIVAAGGGGHAAQPVTGRQLMDGMAGIGFIVLQKNA
jgi:hypothetical protein